MSDEHRVAPELARKMWRTLEPYHGMIYFTPRATEAYAGLGITGRTGYFASRSAPMGAVGADVVVATFFNFHPELVRRSMAGAWETASPAAVLEARLAGADAALRDVLGDEVLASAEMAEAATLARAAATGLPLEGRPLFAGHASLPWPDDDHLILWHAITLLREFRGDGHIAALLAADLDGCESLVTHAASGDVPSMILQASRSWSDEEWDAAVKRLLERGLVDSSAMFTDEGVELRDQVEDATDRLAAAPWQTLGTEDCDRLRSLVRPFSKAIVASGVFALPAT